MTGGTLTARDLAALAQAAKAGTYAWAANREHDHTPRPDWVLQADAAVHAVDQLLGQLEVEVGAA